MPRPHRRVTPCPVVDQFPTFADTCSWLAQEACQCIWYLPDLGRCCKVGIQLDENRLVLQLATKLCQGHPFNTRSLQTLAEIAERSCCTRHHRNKIWGTKLADGLAVRWQSEIRQTLSVTTLAVVQTNKLEEMTFLTYGSGHQGLHNMPTQHFHGRWNSQYMQFWKRRLWFRPFCRRSILQRAQ